MKWVETPEDPKEFSGKDILKALGEGKDKEDGSAFAYDPEMRRLKDEMVKLLHGHAEEQDTGVTYITVDSAPRPVIDIMTAINGGKLPNIHARLFVVLDLMPLPLAHEIAKVAKEMINDKALHERLGLTIKKLKDEEYGKDF